MPASNLAAELGNVVIALYVVDLGLIIWTDLQRNQPRLAGVTRAICVLNSAKFSIGAFSEAA